MNVHTNHKYMVLFKDKVLFMKLDDDPPGGFIKSPCSIMLHGWHCFMFCLVYVYFFFVFLLRSLGNNWIGSFCERVFCAIIFAFLFFFVILFASQRENERKIMSYAWKNSSFEKTRMANRMGWHLCHPSRLSMAWQARTSYSSACTKANAKNNKRIHF